MGRNRDRSADVIELPRLTKAQCRVFNSLTTEWKTASQIVGDDAPPTEIASASTTRRANELVRLGLVEKSGAYRNPAWRHAAIVRKLVR